MGLVSNTNIFDELRKPRGHTDRGCFNCIHHTEIVKCAKDIGSVWNGYKVSCIAYFDHEHARKDLVKLDTLDPISAELWQAHWEWNGKF